MLNLEDKLFIMSYINASDKLKDLVDYFLTMPQSFPKKEEDQQQTELSA